jgi:hypothetical protein
MYSTDRVAKDEAFTIFSLFDLQQLLNDEPKSDGNHREAKRPRRNELLQKLLQQVEDEDDDKVNVVRMGAG